MGGSGERVCGGISVGAERDLGKDEELNCGPNEGCGARSEDESICGTLRMEEKEVGGGFSVV